MTITKGIVGLVKRIYKHFDTPPEEIELVNYMFYIVSNISMTFAWASHLGWMVLFYFLNVPTMVYIQFVSIFIYFIGINTNRRGYHMFSMALCISEIVAHQVIAVRLLGWDTGFQYFIPVVAIFPFLIPKGNKIIPWIIFIMCLSGYLFIDLYLRNFEPIYHLNTLPMTAIKISNIILSFGCFALWAISLIQAVNRSQVIIEEKTSALTKVEEAKKQAEIQAKLDLKEQENTIITKEKVRYEELLLNILPEEVVRELKESGKSEARVYEMVTVMFTDFKDFTAIGEQMTASELVKEIDFCFSSFDKIIQKHGIEKIKTIGDSYMCVSGLPIVNKTHALEIVKAGLEIRDFMENHKKEKLAKGETPFDIRIGINTGPVVAGIVGVKKFAYDIWGDTVNLASRMESSGEAGKVNISGSTYQLIKDKFTCTHRGKIQAKNKGEIDMYFVEVL